jgi:hypothetical protein
MMLAMRRALLLGVLSFAGCSLFGGGTPPRNELSLESEHPEAMRVAGWIEFPSLTIRTADQAAAPQPPFVRGFFRGGWFETEGKVEGEIAPPPPRRVLKRGVLVLATRAFVADGSDIPVRGAAIVGFQDQETGAFHPAAAVNAAGPSK